MGKAILKLTLFFAGACAMLLAQTATVDVPAPVRTALERNCAVCHQGAQAPSGLKLSTPPFPGSALDVPSREKPEYKIIDTAAPETSYLLAKIKGAPGIGGNRMPPSGPLAKKIIQEIESWILSLKGKPAGLPARTASSAAAAGNGRPPFWGTRLVNLPTTASLKKGEVLLLIAHRFLPPVSDGTKTFFGLDGPASVYVGLGYGFGDRLAFSLGRSNLDQEWEAAADWRPRVFPDSSPFGLKVRAGGSWISRKKESGEVLPGSERLRAFGLVSLSYRATDRLSLLLVPGYASNTNGPADSLRGTVILGVGLRYIVLGEMSLLAEWLPVLGGHKDSCSGWGLGIERKIGGHVFQVFVTDAAGIETAQFLPGGDLKLGNGDFRIGFHIFRSF